MINWRWALRYLRLTRTVRTMSLFISGLEALTHTANVKRNVLQCTRIALLTEITWSFSRDTIHKLCNCLFRHYVSDWQDDTRRTQATCRMSVICPHTNPRFLRWVPRAVRSDSEVRLLIVICSIDDVVTMWRWQCDATFSLSHAMTCQVEIIIDAGAHVHTSTSAGTDWQQRKATRSITLVVTVFAQIVRIQMRGQSAVDVAFGAQKLQSTLTGLRSVLGSCVERSVTCWSLFLVPKIARGKCWAVLRSDVQRSTGRKHATCL